MEKTLVLVKPDGVQRGLIGEVIVRLERRGLKLVAAKFLCGQHRAGRKALCRAQREKLLR